MSRRETEHELTSLKELFLAEIHRLDERAISAQTALELLAEERRRSQDKFEATVSARIAQLNEFRGALADLSKDMATRRDLESAVTTLKAERDSLYQGLTNQLGEFGQRIGELEKNVAVGPAGLKTLQGLSDQSVGAERYAQRISGSVVAWAAVGIVFLSALIGVVLKYA